MGLGPIPFTAILQYAEFKECDRELTEDLVQHVLALDAYYLNREAKKVKK